MRKRVDQLGVAQPEIQRSGGDEIDVALPDVSNASRAQDEVGKTAQLYFYDWETNVIGPEGKPAPTDGTVTGNSTLQGAGGAIRRADPVPGGRCAPPNARRSRTATRRRTRPDAPPSR